MIVLIHRSIRERYVSDIFMRLILQFMLWSMWFSSVVRDLDRWVSGHYVWRP